ncbi:uncharacterized protein V1518DRAFT_409067 [Limtongia smithiae]|uniref:uncharacterized protein n=1 Tax=Limtongia smithiae TaxID=1125753 RepID=UPI0034CD640A
MSKVSRRAIPLFRTNVLHYDNATSGTALFQPNTISHIADSAFSSKLEFGRISDRKVRRSGRINVLHQDEVSPPQHDYFESLNSKIFEDVLTRWNVMRRRKVVFEPTKSEDLHQDAGQEDNMSFRPHLLTGDILKKERQSKMLSDKYRNRLLSSEFLRKLLHHGLIYRSPTDLWWSSQARDYFQNDEVINYEFTGPCRLKISDKYLVPIGMRYTVRLNTSQGSSVTHLDVSFHRLDTLWAAQAVLLEVPDTAEVSDYFEVGHPLEPTFRLPVIVRRFHSSGFQARARFLIPGHDSTDHAICIGCNDLQINVGPMYNEAGIWLNMQHFRDLKGLHKYDTVGQAFVILRKNSDLQFSSTPYSGTLPICRITGDLLDRRPVLGWFAHVPSVSRNSIVNGLFASAAGSESLIRTAREYLCNRQPPVLVGYDQDLLFASRSSESLPLIILDGKPIIAPTGQFLPAVYARRFQEISDIAIRGQWKSSVLSYYVCTAESFTTKFAPATALAIAMNNNIPAKRVILLNKLSPSQPAPPTSSRQNIHGQVVTPIAHWKKTYRKFGVDALRITLLQKSLPAEVPTTTVVEDKLIEPALQVSLLWKMYRWFQRNIGTHGLGVPVHLIDFSVMKLLPHEQQILYDLQALIFDVDKDFNDYRPVDALNRLLDFLENRFYREYFQIVQAEVAHLTGRQELSYDSVQKKYLFWSNSRGYVLASTCLKTLDFVLRMLHPFMPVITDVINLQLSSDYFGRRTLDASYYPCTNIAAPSFDLEIALPKFVMPDCDIRYQNPPNGMPFYSDVGYIAPAVSQALNKIYDVIKALQFLRWKSQLEMTGTKEDSSNSNKSQNSSGLSDISDAERENTEIEVRMPEGIIASWNSNPPIFGQKRTDDIQWIESRHFAAAGITKSNIRPSFDYQEFSKLTYLDPKVSGILVLDGAEGVDRQTRMFSLYRTDIGRSARLWTFEVYSTDPEPTEVIDSLTLSHDMKVYLVKSSSRRNVIREL